MLFLMCTNCVFSLLSIPSVVVTISTLVNPQPSGETRPLDARSVSSLPVVLADCVEQRPSRRKKTKLYLHNKTCPTKAGLSHVHFLSIWMNTLNLLHV